MNLKEEVLHIKKEHGMLRKDVDYLKEEQLTLTSQIMVGVDSFTSEIKKVHLEQTEKISALNELHKSTHAEYKVYRKEQREDIHSITHSVDTLVSALFKHIGEAKDLNTKLTLLADKAGRNEQDITNYKKKFIPMLLLVCIILIVWPEPARDIYAIIKDTVSGVYHMKGE